MQNSQVWTSTYRHDGSGVHGSPPQNNKTRSSIPAEATSPAQLNQVSLNGQGPQPDIWSPMFHRGSLGSSALRGSSFGAYSAFSTSQRTTPSSSFDSERFRSGGVAWGSAELPRRRLQSFPSAEPGTINAVASPGAAQSPAEREPFLALLKHAPVPSPAQQLDFTGPAISVLERFSNLGDATRRAELAGASGSSNAAELAAGSETATPQISPHPSHTQLWVPPTNNIAAAASTAAAAPTAAPAGSSGSTIPVPIPVPVPVPVPSVPGATTAAAAAAAGRPLTGLGSQASLGSGRSGQKPTLASRKISPTPLSASTSSAGSSSASLPSAGSRAGASSTGNLVAPANGLTGAIASGGSANGINSNGHGSPGHSANSIGSGNGSNGSATSTINSGGNSTHRGRRKRVESPFLERLRTAPSGSLQLADILGNVLEASTDQHGSRFIQDRLAISPEDVKHQFLSEVLPYALELSTDVFGNYVVQLLFEVSSEEDRLQLWSVIKDNVLTLTLQMYGCRVVQMALRYLNRSAQQGIVAELRGNVLRCIRDHNGNHVVQKAVEYAHPEDIEFIYQDMLRQALPLAKHMYGCRVVQRALEHGSEEARTKLLSTIEANIDTLVLDQYGNYVVQHVVEHGQPKDRDYVLDRLIANVVMLSGHKYASNVIEKCFIKSSPAQRTQIVDAITAATIDGEPAVLSMMKDQYANYVIQRILGTARDEDYDRLALIVRKYLPIVKRSHHGKHLQAIERRLRH